MLRHIHALEIFEVHLDCTGSHTLVSWSGCFPRLRSYCGAVCLLGLGHFSRRLSRPFVAGAAGWIWWGSWHALSWQVQ